MSEESLRRSARELGLSDTVRFFPQITDAGRYFTAFDAFVLSSRSEGLPVVLFEAMAARAPIVATRVGGVPEAVGDGEAVLVPSEDPGALAEGIRTTLADPVSTRRRVEQATARLNSAFSFELWLDRYERVYRGLIERRAS
jgi:glycosyltransferase involved in cell wall biosynthesis